jgi:hypothetical protein
MFQTKKGSCEVNIKHGNKDRKQLSTITLLSKISVAIKTASYVGCNGN